MVAERPFRRRTAATELDWFSFRSAVQAGRPTMVPVGSIEQHGPHLPLCTDALIADRLAHELALASDGLSMPVISYGAPSRPRSGGGDGFPAPAVSLTTLHDTLEAVARGCLRSGVKQLVVLSWHFENEAVLWDALRAARDAHRGDAQIILFAAPWDFIHSASLQSLFGSGGAQEIDWASDHAGLLETAIMRGLAADLVGEVPAPVSFAGRHYEVLPTPHDAVPATGVVNDARHVTAEAGRRCFDDMVAAMAAAIALERDRHSTR